jgi:branched-chain amino acid transport system substrate-binding protein
MQSRKPPFLKALLASAAIALGATAAQAQTQDITVGVVLATSGAGSAVGVPTRNAVALWPAEIGGRKLKLVIQDDRSDPAAGTSIARRLVSEDKVDVIVGGSLTPGSLAIAAVANEAEVPHMTLAPTVLNEKLSTWSFNLPPTTNLMASAVFEHMARAKVQSVGYIGFTDVWGDQWLGELKNQAAKG